MKIKKITKFSFLFLIEKYKKIFFIFVEIRFGKIFNQIKKNFNKILIKWVQKKILFNFSTNALISLRRDFLDFKKIGSKLSEKRNFFKKNSKPKKITFYFFLKTFLFQKKNF